MTRRSALRAACVLALVGWLVFALVTATTLLRGGSPGTGSVFQVDWHVYWAGARDLLDGDLYRTPLDAAGLALSTPDFNLPPMSAVWAVPFLPFPVTAAGYGWQLLAAAAVAVSAGVAAWMARLPRPMLLAGAVLGVLSLSLLYIEGLHLGTNNYLVLGFLALAVGAYVKGMDRWAGVLLGLAIATKLWPATLLVVALRDRRMAVVAIALGVVAIQAILLFGWLGFDAVPRFLANLREPIPPTGYLIGPSSVPAVRALWAGGLGILIGAGLLVLPLRGLVGIGVAILAGLLAIPNLWIHYGLTVLFAVSLVSIAALRGNRTS